MGTIKGLQRKVAAIDITQVIETVFVHHEKMLTDKNKDQLRHGLNRYQTKLRPYKNGAYATKKNIQNPLPGMGNPDLYLTGDFYRGWEKRIDGNVIRDVLNDPKAIFLPTKYPNIFGLGGSYRMEAISILRPAIVHVVRQKLGL